jgi:hypothetical protein
MPLWHDDLDRHLDPTCLQYSGDNLLALDRQYLCDACLMFAAYLRYAEDHQSRFLPRTLGFDGMARGRFLSRLKRAGVGESRERADSKRAAGPGFHHVNAH